MDNDRKKTIVFENCVWKFTKRSYLFGGRTNSDNEPVIRSSMG